MSTEAIKEAIRAGADGDDLASIPLPSTYRAAHTLRAEQEMFAGVPSAEKDPRKSLHVGEVPLPELAPDEVVVAVVLTAGQDLRKTTANLLAPLVFNPRKNLARQVILEGTGHPVRASIFEEPRRAAQAG